MVHTFIDGTYRVTNLTTESAEYLAKREELRLAEVELMRQRERVAALRRNLPDGAAIQDYQFEEVPRDLSAGDAPVGNVKLSELFTKPDRSLFESPKTRQESGHLSHRIASSAGRDKCRISP
jgi:predicted dithiol-disulfide oxidoreductase (DUF899 family)